MLKLRIFLMLLFIAGPQMGLATAHSLSVAQSRCLAHPSKTPELYHNEFSWGYSLEQLEEKFESVYDSGMRLGRHAQYDPKTKVFQLFLSQGKSLVPVPLTADFIKNVTRQIEIAIEKGYSDYVLYSDMGHSHLFFPEDHWEEEYTTDDAKNLSPQDFKAKLLADKKMRPLYHLTEQLAMVDDDKQPLDNGILAHKYWNRNYWGSNDGSDTFVTLILKDKTRFNTIASIPGQFKYSAGFAVSGSKDGCFPYKDKNGVTRYFDISLYDPAQDPSAPIEFDL